MNDLQVQLHDLSKSHFNNLIRLVVKESVIFLLTNNLGNNK
jgi:hypothetical protein